MKKWSTSNGHDILQILSGRSNVFLITKGSIHIIVDTGPKFMWNTLQNRLSRLGIDQIDLLILTHSHFDHAGNSSRIKEKYKARIVIHKNESNYLLSGDNIIPKGTNPFAKFLMRIFAEKFKSYTLYEPCNYDYLVDEHFSLSDFGFNAFLIHTPGHTQGSICVIIDDEIALVGDTMFGVFPWSIYPPFANDPDHLIKSWEKLVKTKCHIFIPSHGSANRRNLVEKEFQKRYSLRTSQL